MKTIKGFLLGMAVGVLFAPRKGSKTRRKIAKVFTDYKEDAKDYLVDAADNLESKVESVKDTIQSM